MPGYNPVLGEDHPDGPDEANSGRIKWNAQHEEAFQRLDDLETLPPITDHGVLSGLGDDDHPQYHNNTRGDLRYYQKAEVDSALSGKASTTSVSTVQTAVNDHLADSTDAHDASAISFVPASTVAATDVQGAIAEVASEAGAAASAVQTNLNNHTGDSVDAHDASAISFVPAGTIASTDVQSAIAEVASEAGSGGGGSFSYVSLVKFGAA